MIEYKKLVYNAIRTPDGTLLESRSVHDYVTHMDKNGYEYMVDGGLDYLRRNITPGADAEELSLYTDSPHEKVREVVKWGTYGKQGTEALKFVTIASMDTEHLETIVNEDIAKPWLNDIMKAEIDYRGEQDDVDNMEDG